MSSIPAALDRLQREGWLRFVRPENHANAEPTYSLTEAGEQRLEQERVRRSWLVSQFVENSKLDQSFRRFLERQGLLWLS